MAAVAASLATQISIIRSSISTFQPNIAFVPRTGTHLHLHPKTTSLKRLSLICASSEPKTDQSTDDDRAAFVSQEDVKYLVQLGGVSVAGAAAIKYGSIIFPEITQPNLAQALFMIFAPVIVAILLLFKQSRAGVD